MSSSTLCSMLFTLSLILISHAPLPTQGDKLYKEVCNRAGNDNARCLQVLQSDPRIAAAKNYVQLSNLILEMGLKKGSEAQNYFKGLMKTNPSPAIAECATTLYDGVIGSFRSSMGELTEDGLTANYDAKVAGDGPVTCDRALAEAKISNPTLAALNRDVLLLSTLAYFATDKLPSA